MTTTEQWTCTETDWCTPLNTALHDEANAHKAGLTVIRVAGRTSAPRLAGIAFKKKPADKGVYLTFCPWCGVKLADVITTES